MMVDDVVVCRYLSEIMSDSDRQKLNQWQKRDVKNKQMLIDFKSIWRLAEIPDHNSSVLFNSRVAWLKLGKVLSERKDYRYSKKNDGKEHRIKKLPSKVKEFIEK